MRLDKAALGKYIVKSRCDSPRPLMPSRKNYLFPPMAKPGRHSDGNITTQTWSFGIPKWPTQYWSLLGERSLRPYQDHGPQM